MNQREQNPEAVNLEVLKSLVGDYWNRNTANTDCDDADDDAIRTRWQCPNCRAGLAWPSHYYQPISGTFMAPPLCDTCAPRRLGINDEKTVRWVAANHDVATHECATCHWIRQVLWSVAA